MNGLLKDLFYNFSSRTTEVLLEIDGNVHDDLVGLKGQRIKADIRKWYKRRSLNANAYYWELLGKLANYYKLDNMQTHNMMLRRYSEPWLNGNGELNCWYIPAKTDIDHSEDYHFQIVERDIFLKGIPYIRVCLLVPSHLMNTKQMSRLIDGVVGECKDAGIETIPPEELERMIGKWEPKK